MLGLTGSGKTTFARNLGEKLSLDVLSLDVEYEKQGGELSDHIWNEKAATSANEVIKAKVREYVSSDKSIILDFCPWTKGDRMAYRDFVEGLGATCITYYLDLPIGELKTRLQSRTDGQVVTDEMLNDFVHRFESPTGDEEFILA